MNKTLKFWILFILVSATSEFGLAQEPLTRSNPIDDFKKAEAFLDVFKNDSANVILIQLLDELKATDSLNTPFGLEVQLRQAEALEKDHKDEAAIQKLLHVVEASKKEKQWEVLAHAYLSLARLHEKLNREKECLADLDAANYYITQHNLASVYPRYAIRNSSYHRLFADRDSAIFYAQEVLHTAPQFDLDQDEAVGYMLMGLLLAYSSYQDAVQHFQTAGNTWKKVEDYSGYGGILSNLSRLHLRNNKAELALAYNDSSLVAAQLSEDMGHDAPYQFYLNYIDRAEIYKTLGQKDSALFYFQKGYEMQLQDVLQANSDKVVAIEAQYNNEKKEQQIKDQAQLLDYEKERKTWLWLVITFGSGLLALLSFYYLKLRKANIKTLQQAQVINQTNDELSASLHQQMMLQGEVHHRVKNNLQVIISLLELQFEDINDPKALKSLEAMSNRIYSMAAIHEMLYQKEGTQLVNLLDYAQTLCNHYQNFATQKNKPIFDIEIEEQYFNIETLMPLGIILNELLTNSLKYASGISRQLKIKIKLLPQIDGYCISYRDNGPGFPVGVLQERDGGLGSYLLKSMSRQLNGHLESMNDGGAVFNIFFKEKNNQRTS